VTAKLVVIRAQADRDIENAIDHYLREAGEPIALGFIDAVQSIFRASDPAIGSTRYAYELDIPSLRTRSLRSYPYLVFYIERDDDIDIWRILHAHRDIPAWMQSPEGA
jgi:toxin ParE1/3/4